VSLNSYIISRFQSNIKYRDMEAVKVRKSLKLRTDKGTTFESTEVLTTMGKNTELVTVEENERKKVRSGGHKRKNVRSGGHGRKKMGGHERN
jgi:thioredoxin reductase